MRPQHILVIILALVFFAGAVIFVNADLKNLALIASIGLLMLLALIYPPSLAYLFSMLIAVEDLLILIPNLTFTRLAGVVLVFAYFLRRKGDRSKPLFPISFRIACVWFVLACLSLLWSIRPDVSFNRLQDVAQLILMSFLLINLITSPTQARIVLFMFALGSLFEAAIGLFATSQSASFISAQLARTSAVATQSATLYASVVSLGATIFLCMAFHSLWKGKLIYGLVGVVSLIAILTAAGRGALVGLSAVGLVLLFSIWRTWGRLIIFLVFVPLGLVFVWNLALSNGLLSDTVLKRLSLENAIDSGGAGRFNIQQGMLLYTFPRQPILGYGLGTAPNAQSVTPEAVALAGRTYRDPHNDLLEVLIDLGLVGLFIWLLFQYQIWKDLISHRQSLLKTMPDLYWLAICLLVEVFVNDLSGTYIFEKRTWLVFSIAIVLPSLAAKPETTPEPAIHKPPIILQQTTRAKEIP